MLLCWKVLVPYFIFTSGYANCGGSPCDLSFPGHVCYRYGVSVTQNSVCWALSPAMCTSAVCTRRDQQAYFCSNHYNIMHYSSRLNVNCSNVGLYIACLVKEVRV